MMKRTLDEIVATEPQVGRILRDAKAEAFRQDMREALYSRYKGLLARWVGWYAPNEDLRDPVHYQTVVEALCDALGL